MIIQLQSSLEFCQHGFTQIGNVATSSLLHFEEIIITIHLFVSLLGIDFISFVSAFVHPVRFIGGGDRCRGCSKLRPNLLCI